MRNYLYNRKEIQGILDKNSLALKKRWGQNFLANYFFADKIVQLVLSNTEKNMFQDTLRIWEIGAGLGTLSNLFLFHNVELTLFEIDYGILRFLKTEFAQEIEQKKIILVEGDAEKTVPSHVQLLEKNALPNIICGNLPYSSSVRIIIQICSLELLHVPSVYMIQKEAVERLLSKQGTSQYGISSILVQSQYKVSKKFSVSVDSFYPIPHVESQVFSCIPNNAHIGDQAYSLLCRIIREAFSQRRKKLRNTLIPFLLSFLGDIYTKSNNTSIENINHVKDTMQHILKKFSIDEHARAQDIPVQSYNNLAKYLNDLKNE